MVSAVLPGLVLSLLLVSAAWAEHCTSYSDNSGRYKEDFRCYFQYCCGNCNNKYCCSESKYHLTQEMQGRCSVRFNSDKVGRLAVLLGSILGSFFPLIICVVLIICCVAPCCLLYKKCRKGRNRRHQTVINTATVVHAPLQPQSPAGNLPSYRAYHPVPVQPGYSDAPLPTAPPPPYMEATDPLYYPVPFTPGQPSYPLQPTEQAHVLPPQQDQLAQPPFNPLYGSNL